MSDKEMNIAILNKLYEIADKVFNEGVNVGDALTFIDGTKVIAAEDNKVLFGGRLFTLSGFCKDFMPDEKRTKSNTYRGCAFFFKDGVKLEKLFKDAQKESLVSSKEDIAAVPNDEPSELIDWLGKVFIDFKNKLAYKVHGYDTRIYPHYLYTEIRADGSFIWHGGAEKSEFEEMISHCTVIEYTDENTIMDVIHTYLNSVPNEPITAVPDDNDSLQNTINAQVKFYLENVCYILGEDGKPRRWNVIKYLKETDEFVVECMDIPNKPTWIEDRKQFAARYHSISITESRYYSIINNDPILKEICKWQYKEPFDSVPNEHQASDKCTERTITPLENENVSGRKETASTAKVVAISIGVPSCLDIQSDNMRFDIAANKPLNAVVCDCLCGVGKVVHTLPLPPPRSKRMSEIIKVNH